MILQTIEEIAPVLRVKPITIRRLLAAGLLPHTRVGRRYLFSEKNISDYLTHNEKNISEHQPE